VTHATYTLIDGRSCCRHLPTTDPNWGKNNLSSLRADKMKLADFRLFTFLTNIDTKAKINFPEFFFIFLKNAEILKKGIRKGGEYKRGKI
jgi:hypothetical protein